MPDPVPTAGRDDVLASIRRLVLDQALPASGPGRLVLTPALRVAAPEAPETPREADVAPPPAEEALPEPVAGPGADAEPEPERPDAVPPPLVLTAPVPPSAGHALEIEAAVADRAQDWEPDGSEEPEHWSLGEVPPEPVFRHRLPALEAPAVLPEIDEDRLRELITEVVRSELQGELGERMTRNIRRLVRREIFRVLESRED